MLPFGELNLPPLPERFGNPMLRGFNEIESAARISWLPEAPGWWLLGAGIVVVGSYKSWRSLRRWLRNRYRREALAQLQRLARQNNPNPAAINELLKIAAIAASSRGEVASLSGDTWVEWLNQRQNTPLSPSTRRCLTDTLYRGEPEIDPATRAALLHDAKTWLLTHRDDHGPA